MAVRLREALATLPGYVGGRTVPDAIKLASNETPYPALPHVVARLTDTLRAANRYPDPPRPNSPRRSPSATTLPVTQVVVGCGSVSLCQQLVQISTQVGDEVVYGWRAFEAYPIVAAIAGAGARPGAAARRGARPRGDGRRGNRRHSAGVRVQPEQPDRHGGPGGRPEGVPRRGAGSCARRCRRGLPRVRDRSRCPGRSDASRRSSQSGGVAYVLQGIRARRTAGWLRVGRRPGGGRRASSRCRCRSPSARSPRMPRLRAWIRKRRRSCSRGSRRFSPSGPGSRTRYASMGYAVPPTQANFVWLALGERTADWAAGCAEQRVIVRPFAGEGVRVTIGTPDENDQFLDAARALAE